MERKRYLKVSALRCHGPAPCAPCNGGTRPHFERNTAVLVSGTSCLTNTCTNGEYVPVWFAEAPVNGSRNYHSPENEESGTPGVEVKLPVRGGR